VTVVVQERSGPVLRDVVVSGLSHQLVGLIIGRV